jgi:adenylosuccinate synthase
MGEYLRTEGAEFGATTGRPRRCGWLDLVALKYSVMVNGISHIALTKLDVLDKLKEIKICTGYKVAGKLLKYFPIDLPTLNKLECEFVTVPGWNRTLKGITRYEDLPRETLDYFKIIEEFTGAEISIVSLSPDRNDTIIK